MRPLGLYIAVLLSVSGCRCPQFISTHSIDIENCSGMFQYWDIVIETLQLDEYGSVDLEIDMHGRMKWFRLYDTYCHTRSPSCRGCWFVWMFHDDDGIVCCPSSHTSARLTKCLPQCDTLHARTFVPVLGEMSQLSHIVVRNEIDASQQNYIDENWPNVKEVSIAIFRHNVKSNMKGEIRMPVKLFNGARVKFTARSDRVVSLKVERRDSTNIKEIDESEYVPRWENLEELEGDH